MTPTQRGKPDFLFLILTVCLLGFGVLMVFSSSSAISIHDYGTPWHFTIRQIVFACAGLFVMIVLMNLRVRFLRKLAFILLLISVVMLIMVLLIGISRHGATRWIAIPGIGFQLQPAEFVKIAMVIYIAAFISKEDGRIRDFKRGLLPVIIVTAIIAVLLLAQPDFGSTVIIICTVFMMLFVGGMKLKHLLLISLSSVPAIIYLLMEDYRMRRILSFLNPWDDPADGGFQLIQSLYAFGHGEIYGAGFGSSIQKLHYLPFPYNDFIFPIIAEELGFIGSFIFLTAYLVWLLRAWIICMRSNDLFAAMLGKGIVIVIFIQAIFNLGGTTGLIPITGLTLPLISYGGSSLLVTLASVGLILSISRQNHKYQLADEGPGNTAKPPLQVINKPH